MAKRDWILGLGLTAGAVLGAAAAVAVSQRRTERSVVASEKGAADDFLPAWPLEGWIGRVQWPETEAKLTVRRPHDLNVLGETPVYSRAQVAAVAARARAAQPAWAALSVKERLKPFWRLHDLLIENYHTVADLLQAEGGKTRRDAVAEVIDVVNVIRYYGTKAEGWLRGQWRRPGLPGSSLARVIYKPYGVVGAITPWNFPLVLAVSDIVAPLLAGNTVIVKTAEQTPYTALWAAEQLGLLGLPDGVLQVITGDGRETGDALIDQVDFIMFTGSNPVGQHISKRAGERMIPATLELGGKNPAIVLPDTDLDMATDRLLEASFGFNGQLCISIERAYVPEPMLPAFSAMLKYKVAQLKLGVDADYGTQIGPLMMQPQVDKFVAHIDDAVAKGATVVTGGKTRPDVGPNYVEPTVLVNVPSSATLFREETFGPVLALYPYRTVDEAIAMANDTIYGLNGLVLSSNPAGALAQYVAERLDCGTVGVNDMMQSWQSYAMPMGGLKRSGLGRRHGPEGLLKYVQPQGIGTLLWPHLQHFAPPLGLGGRLMDAMFVLLRVWRWIPLVR